MKLSDLDAKLVSLTKNQPVKKFPLPNGKLLVSQSFQIEEHKKELSPENKKKTLFQKNSLIKAQGTLHPQHKSSMLEVPPANFNTNKEKVKKRKHDKMKTGIIASPTRLKISEKDLIKIDSNTLISEELRHVEFIENDNGFSIRDNELFDSKAMKSTSAEGKKESFFMFLEKEKNKEINRKDGIYFRFFAKKGNFIKRIQIHQEIQTMLHKKGVGEKGYLERKGRMKVYSAELNEFLS